jgi:acylphosphatase
MGEKKAEKEVRAHCTFHGRVQGVCFRAYAREFANRLGVKGWVRNHWNGDVEAVFEGSKASVEAVIRMCKEEQPHARVASIDVAWGEPEGKWDGFYVQH